MKTTLLQPPYPPYSGVLRDHAGKFGVKTRREIIFPPLDLAYVASVLDKDGHDVDLIDAPALNSDADWVLAKLLKDQPEIVVVDACLVSLSEDLLIADAIKKELPHTCVCVTGSPSVMPDIAFATSDIDIVITNEIEQTIRELPVALENRCLNHVKGIKYRKNDVVIENPDRPLIADLDDLPFPAYDRLPVNNYHYDLLPKKPFVTMLTSRGCPFGCIYCPYPIGYGHTWRCRSAGNVIAEIQYLVDKLHVRSILFRDQVFTFDMKRAEEICKALVERGVDIDWRCETRIDKLSGRLMAIMKRAGCVGLHLGVESGDSSLLSGLAKKGVSISMTRKIFREAKNLGLETFAFFMLGLPGQSKRSIWKSYMLIKEIKPDTVQFTIATPYPGTQLYRMAEEKGWILTRNWKRYDGFDVVMKTDELSEKDIRCARKYLEDCLTYQRNFLGRKEFGSRSVLGGFPGILKLLKKFSSGLGHYFTQNVENEFRRWAS